METWAVTNEEQARYWNGDESAHWLVHEERYERMLAPFTGRLLSAAAIGRADRVVDIGCGTGSTTREVEHARLLCAQATVSAKSQPRPASPRTSLHRYRTTDDQMIRVSHESVAVPHC